MLLSDDELWALVPNAGNLKDARAIEAAILAKLAVAELPPLPAYECGPHTGHAAVRTDESIRAYGIQAHAQGFAAGAAAQLSAEPVGVVSEYEGMSLDHTKAVFNRSDAYIGTPLYTRREA